MVSVIGIFFYGVVVSKDESTLYYKDEFSNSFRLVIPNIEFDMVIYDMNSEYNDVEYNVEMLESSLVSENVYFFAGHSGNGDNCYFNRIKELEYGDVVYIFKGDERLVYKIILKYNIVKSGYMEVDYEMEDVLYLITCNSYSRQLIVKGVLIN